MMKINKPQSEDKCSKCTHYQKQNAKLTTAFINADDESIRRSVQYEDKILELKAKIEHLKAEKRSPTEMVQSTNARKPKASHSRRKGRITTT
jgi:hypothetical protein